MSKVIYTVYKITNIINNKIYIGVHKTNDPHDSYYGTGILISKAIKKYGKENFTKDIIATFNTPEYAFALEKLIVNEDFIKNNNTYNLCVGGLGAVGNLIPSEETKKLMSEKRKLRLPPTLGKNLPKWTEERRQKFSNTINKTNRRSSRLGAILTKETKSKMSESAKNRVKHTCPICNKQMNNANLVRHIKKCN
jgi:hypothetical protein